VVVADDKVHAQFAGVGHLVGRLDAAVKAHDQFYALGVGKVEALPRNAVPFGVAVGHVVDQVGMEGLQEAVEQRHRRGTVHVVVAVHHDGLILPEGFFEPGPLPGPCPSSGRDRAGLGGRTEIRFGFGVGRNAPLQQQSRYRVVHAYVGGQRRCLRGGRHRFERPAVFHRTNKVVDKKIAAEDSKAILTKLHFSRNNGAAAASRQIPLCAKLSYFYGWQKNCRWQTVIYRRPSDFNTRVEITFIQILFS
jgi:hypothetical protein